LGVIAAWNEGPGKEKKTVDCARKMGSEMIRTYGIYSQYSLQKALEKMYVLCYNIGYHTEEDGETVLADEFGKA
jgi:hypothetical protein